MLVGWYAPLIVARLPRGQPALPQRAGTLRTDTGVLAGPLIATIVLLALLDFVPRSCSPPGGRPGHEPALTSAIPRSGNPLPGP
jgi:K+-transporting ATPase A subunit